MASALPKALRRLLAQVTPDSAQGEYHLTDLVALAIAEGQRPYSMASRISAAN